MSELKSETTINNWKGIGLALLAALIWSGNFIVARSVSHIVPPISLSFYRWATAVAFMLPLALTSIRKDLPLIKKHWPYLLMVGIFGITLYNSTIYMAGRQLPAVNLSLVTTTSSPVFSITMAAIFLNERISRARILGILVCFSGILYLLCLGSWEKLLHFHFSSGDGIVLLGGFFFATYNILVRKKPKGFSALGFLFAVMIIGTVLLVPAFLIEAHYTPPVEWNSNLILIILYLGIGNSVICYLLWNKSIELLGAGRTALFGNLIPLFSSGLLLANMRK